MFVPFTSFHPLMYSSLYTFVPFTYFHPLCILHFIRLAAFRASTVYLFMPCTRVYRLDKIVVAQWLARVCPVHVVIV